MHTSFTEDEDNEEEHVSALTSPCIFGQSTLNSVVLKQSIMQTLMCMTKHRDSRPGGMQGVPVPVLGSFTVHARVLGFDF